MKEINLTEIGLNFIVNCDKLDEDLRKKIGENYDELDYVDEDGLYFDMSAQDVYDYDVPSEAIENSYWDDTYTVEEYLSEHLPTGYKHYLVFASGCRWNGASGYKMANSLFDAIDRSYDTTQILKKKTRKVATIKESSHDVPMGSMTYIIGLTDKEFEKLDSATFSTVEAFVNSKV